MLKKLGTIELMIKDLFYPELSYKITGVCFKAHNSLGRFAREKQYADKIEELLQEEKISYKREVDLQKILETSPKGNKADFVVGGRIIVDVKAKKFVTKEDYLQMQRYLNGAGIKLGLIINFRGTYLKPKRVLNSSVK